MSATTNQVPNIIEEVTIGTQTWMLHNYDFAGTAYDNDMGNVSGYGKLYTWAEAVAIGASVDGWHLPSDAEFSTLITYLGGVGVAGGYLKETGTDYWETPNEGADNSSGFSARGAGWYDNSSSAFDNLQRVVSWWTSTESGTDAWTRGAVYTTDNTASTLFQKVDLCSIRLIKD